MPRDACVRIVIVVDGFVVGFVGRLRPIGGRVRRVVVRLGGGERRHGDSGFARASGLGRGSRSRPMGFVPVVCDERAVYRPNLPIRRVVLHVFQQQLDQGGGGRARFHDDWIFVVEADRLSGRQAHIALPRRLDVRQLGVSLRQRAPQDMRAVRMKGSNARVAVIQLSHLAFAREAVVVIVFPDAVDRPVFGHLS